MSDETAFLRAIQANPTDATAKLVYADWLDEHGEPDRAAYLRLLATDAPDPNRKRELESRVGGIWGGALISPLPVWDEATLFALGRLEGALETYRAFNERISDLDLDFRVWLVPNAATVSELWRAHRLSVGGAVSLEMLGDWQAALVDILGRWLFTERPVLHSSGLTIETEAGRASAVSEMVAGVRDVLRPQRGWRIRLEPEGFFALDWADLALEAADRVLFFHFSITD